VTISFKVGDKVRRTESHAMGFPVAGYEFVVESVEGNSVFEEGGLHRCHNAAHLELVYRPIQITVPESSPSGEVRTTSATGGEKGVKPEAWALLPSEALEEIARVYDFGAQKYAAHNWRKGYEWSKSFSACMRHMWAWWRGEDLDPESGLSHLGHAGFHVLTMLTFWLERGRYGVFDDRYKSEAVTSTDA